MLAQRVGQGLAALHVIDDLAGDAGQGLVLGLLGQDVERLDEGESGVDHGGELAGEDHDVARLDAALEHAAEGHRGGGLTHLHHHEAVLAQVRDDVVLARQIDLVLDQIALEIARGVFKQWHEASSCRSLAPGGDP